ncbi:MAG TPA: ABC transporter ATP-binding protein [Candidatus Dormibacteraeota bacterium]|nr:ABC transporter ATP-binding protein [Candidatus Dormibacteraeota bacterium]
MIGIQPALMRRRVADSAEWRFFGALRHASPPLAALWWALIILRGLLPALFSIVVGVLVGAVQGGHGLALPLVSMGVVFILMNALSPLHDAIAENLGSQTSRWLQRRLLGAATTPAGLAHLERPELADAMARAREFDLGVSAPTLNQSMGEIGSGFAQIAAGIAQAAVLGRYSWWAALILLVAWASTHVILRDSYSWHLDESEDIADHERHAFYAYRIAVEALAAKEVRLFGLADWVVDRFQSRRRIAVDRRFEQRRLRQGSVGMALLVVGLANALVFGLLAHDALSGAVGLAAVVVYAQAAVGIAAVAAAESDWWFRGAAKPIPEVVDLAGRMAPVGRLDSGSATAQGMPREEVRLRDVRFGYRRDAPPVLDGVDLTIPAGTSMAVVGLNGAGKTTLAKLLCRLYDPWEGAITVDGTDLRGLDLEQWRGQLAAVFQDFIRFELPLRVNVAPQGAPDGAVEEALATAGASGLASLDRILSRGYEGGTDLSGGQWQRVALARALCRVRLGAGMILLDEPTAQIDVRGEAEIFDRLLEATRGCTTVLISHRLSSVRHADRICVLEKGRVVELGSHEELMAQEGRYRTLFDLQASRFAQGMGAEEDEDPMEYDDGR